MRFLDEERTARWVEEHASRADVSFSPVGATVAVMPGSVQALNPAGAASFARRSLGWVLGSGRGPVLVWVKEWGVWPSAEDLYLYGLVRRANLSAEPVGESPGHLAEAHEFEEAVAVVYLAIWYGWGVVAVAGDGWRSLNIDHDGRCWFASPEGGDLEEARGRFLV